MTNAQGTMQQGAQYVLRSPSAGERLLAATAHLLILLNLPGIVVTATILLLSRRGSPYVRHHARKAIHLQILENILTFGLLAIFAAIIVGSGVFDKGKDPGMALNAAFGAGLGILFVIVVLFSVETLIFGIPAIIGALRALATRQYRYPVAGAK